MRIARHACRCALALVAWAVLTPPLEAPGQDWTLHASAGRAFHEAVEASIDAPSAVLGVHRDGARWLYLAAGLPLDRGALPWASAGMGRRFLSDFHGLYTGVDAGAHGYGYRDTELAATGGGMTVELLPLVVLTSGTGRLELRTGVLHHASTFAGVSDSRLVHHTDARLGLALGSRFSLGGEGRLVRAEEAEYPYAGASLEFSHGRGEARAFAGRWFSDALPGAAWGLGATLRVNDRLNAHLMLQNHPGDPLYWNVSHRSWSVGVSHRFGRERLAAPLPVTARDADGRVTIRVPVSESAAAPFLAGDFTGWEPVRMTRAGDFWIASLQVGPGVHRYAFRSADGEWFLPASVVNRIDDGMGGVSALLVVP